MKVTKKQAISVRDDSGHLLLSQAQGLNESSELGYWGTPEVLTRYSTCCASMWYRIKDRMYQCSTCGSIYDLHNSIASQTPDDAWFYMGPHPIIHTKRSNEKYLSKRYVEAQAFKSPHLETAPSFSPGSSAGKGFSTQMRYDPTQNMYRSRRTPFKVPGIKVTDEDRKGLERWLPFFKGIKESPKKAKNLGLTMLLNLPNFFLLGALGLVGVPQFDLLMSSFEQHKAVVDYNVKRLKRKKGLTEAQNKEYKSLLLQQRMINRKMEQLKKAKVMAGGEDSGWRTIGDKSIYVGPKQETEIPTEFELASEE